MHPQWLTIKIPGLLLIGVLLGSGCGRRTEPGSRAESPPPDRSPANPATAAPPPAHRPGPPPPRTETDAPPAERSPASLAKLAEALRRIQALANAPEPRGSLVTDLSGLADEGVPKPAIADTLGKMFQIEPTVEIRINILDELGALETPAAFDIITAAFSPSQPAEVQEAGSSAAESLLTDLSFQEDQLSLTVIQRAVDARLPQAVRLAGIRALEDRQDPKASPTLQRLLNDPDAEVRDAAKDALEWIQNK